MCRKAVDACIGYQAATCRCLPRADTSLSWASCCCYLPQAAYPHVAKIYSEALPTIITLFLMTIASTWLLLHAASQWARTRSEAKLLHRIPHAAKHALALQQHAHSGTGQASAFGADGSKGGKGVCSDGGGGSMGPSAGGQQLNGKEGAGAGSRGVSSIGEPSAPLDAGAADVPAKSTPAPLASV